MGIGSTYRSFVHVILRIIIRVQNGQKKNGRCKKAGKRRRRDESGDLESGDDTDMICLLKTPYDIAETFKMETIKERLKINSKRFYT